MKIVLIGGGSFVFAPTVLEDIIVKHRLEGCELMLVDPNVEAATSMAEAGRSIANKYGLSMTIQAVADRREALPNSDFVIVSAAVQGAKRWQLDYNILKQFDMPDQARECGGLGGLVNGLRSITLLLDVCRDMEELCPQAWLLDVTNPMPRVVTAINRYSSIRVAGFCNIAYRSDGEYALLAKLVRKHPSEISVVTGGLNHFAWVLEIKDKQTGENLLEPLHEYIRAGMFDEHDDDMRRELRAMQRWLAEYGAVAAGSVDHHAEYLPHQEDIVYTTEPPYHGTEEERVRRNLDLQEIARGERSEHDLFSNPSWEHPVSVAVAIHGGEEVVLDILNVRNNGAIAELPDERIVEVPVVISGGELHPQKLPALPPKLAELIRTLSDVHELVAEAAATGSLEAVNRAITLDPAITDKQSAYVAVSRMIQAHSDLLPQFNK
ncbi:MAG: hypothetical protein P0Y55_11400 [Candidatus Cohnella colombiensis]|uniref:Glycosyl hydrolase family 4 C-terminal domain-containing protein n=1 Tax=Candidatus Cohnella colombiensis TaxID=3121368 RepID=A0AA95JBS8_9BACL|nr:MAG: hypothetical protein P0Y55_11400 [Cohnella sp.]